jgi:hypothetical protein
MMLIFRAGRTLAAIIGDDNRNRGNNDYYR